MSWYGSGKSDISSGVFIGLQSMRGASTGLFGAVLGVAWLRAAFGLNVIGTKSIYFSLNEAAFI